MNTTLKQFNRFLFFKLPAAWWTGVRLIQLDEASAAAQVRHRWVNQNPFRSMFWAVQGMAAELTTGALVMNKIRERKEPISMLVTHMEADFTKKATGRITFKCEAGHELSQVLDAVVTGEAGQSIILSSEGVDEEGDVVARFQFHWSLKKKKPQGKAVTK